VVDAETSGCALSTFFLGSPDEETPKKGVDNVHPVDAVAKTAVINSKGSGNKPYTEWGDHPIHWAALGMGGD